MTKLHSLDFFSRPYLEKSGLRVITAWDEISEKQMGSYVTYCRYLYGVTQQDWQKQKGKIPAYTKQDKLAFLPNYPGYTNNIDVIVNMNKDTIARFDGKQPLFLTAQGVSWRMGPKNLVAMKEKLEALSPGNIVICRGDHFFALYNEANRMDFNLTLSSKLKITSSKTSTRADYAADGTCTAERTWVSSLKGKKWIQFDFKKPCRINRYVIRHAGVNGMDEAWNAKSFTVETSEDGKKWKLADEQPDNRVLVTDVDIAPVQARYVRISINNDGVTAIGDVEIYGN